MKFIPRDPTKSIISDFKSQVLHKYSFDLVTPRYDYQGRVLGWEISGEKGVEAEIENSP